MSMIDARKPRRAETQLEDVDRRVSAGSCLLAVALTVLALLVALSFAGWRGVLIFVVASIFGAAAFGSLIAERGRKNGLVR